MNEETCRPGEVVHDSGIYECDCGQALPAHPYGSGGKRWTFTSVLQ